jgi:hypothetical protein
VVDAAGPAWRALEPDERRAWAAVIGSQVVVVAVATEAEGRVEIPTDEITEVRVVDGCGADADADEQP